MRSLCLWLFLSAIALGDTAILKHPAAGQFSGVMKTPPMAGQAAFTKMQPSGPGFSNLYALNFVASSAQGLNGGKIFGFVKTDTFSFSVWYKHTASGASDVQPIIAKENSDNSAGYFIGPRPSSGTMNAQIQSSNGAYIDIRPAVSWNSSVWNHVVFTYDGSSNSTGMKMYVNNVLLSPSGANGAGTLGDMTNTFDFKIASGTYYANSTMKVDELSIWNKVLSAAEVTSLYNSGHADDVSKLASYATNCLAWYRMGDDTDTPTLIVNRKNPGTYDLNGVNLTTGSLITDAP